MSGCCWLRVDDLGMGVGLGVECVVDASGVDSVLHIQQATGGLLGLRCHTRLEKCTETYLATLGSIRAHQMCGCWCRLRVDDLLIRLGVGLGAGCVVDAGKYSVLHMQLAGDGGLVGPPLSHSAEEVRRDVAGHLGIEEHAPNEWVLLAACRRSWDGCRSGR